MMLVMSLNGVLSVRIAASIFAFVMSVKARFGFGSHHFNVPHQHPSSALRLTVSTPPSDIRQVWFTRARGLPPRTPNSG